jgi:predicted nucleotidyltransferase
METLFNFAPDIPAPKEAVIQSRLSAVERDQNIEFLFAIESGSRAWGFPSPDSDFDVRFVYAHKPERYLTINPERDVIELPLEDDWDINGWDIKKAIGLLLKPNPVLLEWLLSPIRYRWNQVACQKVLDFAERHVRPEQCLTHYYHLAKRQWERNIDGDDRVNLKKYFYVLRPCLAIRWVRLHPTELPPMNFQDLVNGTEISDPLGRRIAELLRAKAKQSEIGAGARIDIIDELIQSELNWALENAPQKHNISREARDQADQLFRDLIGYDKQ